MKKNTQILLLLLAVVISSTMYAQSPNVVVIIADDMGWSQTSSNETSMNNPSDFYETPRIATLAAEGIAFPNSYVNGANCAPTRAAILSGQWASRPTNNVFAVNGLNRGDSNSLLVGPSQGLSNGEDEIPASAITIAETVKTAGYTTAHFGKYHSGGSLNNGPLDQGFDVNFGGDSDGAPGSYFAALSGGNWEFHPRIGPELDIYASPYTAAESLALAGDNSLEGTTKHVTDALGDAAIDFMNANNNTPFFMHFSNYAIHGPWGQANARPDLYAKYVVKNNTNPSQIGHDNVSQAAILEGMDQTIGRIIDYLKTTPDPRNPGNMLSANTLVYFISDNGGANGPEDNVPLKGMKGEYTEGGIRSVTFAWSEGLLANMGTVNNTPIQAFDLYPTLAEISGASLPSGYDIDGVSQWDMLTGVNPNLGRDALYWHFPGYIANSQRDQRPVSIIRKGDYKLIHYYETASYDLYNLTTDISETTNLLAGSPDTATLTIANDMSTDLRNYLINVSAPLPTFRSNGNTVPLPEIIEVTQPPVDPSCVAPDTYAALWNFDSGVGTDDYSANSNNAITVTGTVSYDAVDFKEGDQSIVFDGATKVQYSQNPGPFMIAAMTQRSIAMWVKPTGLSGVQELFEEGGGSNGIAIRLNGATLESVVRSSASPINQLSTAFPNDGDWHHVAVTYNGSITNHSLYVDGLLASSSNAAPTSIPSHIGSGGIAGVQTTDSFGVTADSFFTGKMDAVAVYSTELKAADVRSAGCIEGVDPPTECTYSVINTEGFESGWGIWNDGGSDARRSANDAAYANTGTYCIRLRDNTSTSVMTTDTMDLSAYEELTIDFSYYCRSMDNVNEDFWFQISTDGGANFSTVEEWNLNDEFVNDQRYNDQVIITGPFTANTQLRFRADASGNSDWVYIDDVVINGCSIPASAKGNTQLTNKENTKPMQQELITQNYIISLYPNPFTDQIQISVKGGEYERAEVRIFNSLGQSVFLRSYNNKSEINVSDLQLPVGQYFMKINIDNQVTTKQLIKL
ncbi:sulfatase-like hydrolase/transferase [Aquimarina sp. 2201CG14-23]|uniref:sulfatase-like hydrolase/transferase n=1 Tax=Aquimarina mycalae TaxID=3040073 RepID=UPI0024782E35|nr:sulfatase-like hydrolase/transferase [Aquimarina sp. 2201CG14-23]MDH7444072.1 sulfatase-like hydrolase/transferase [Aquimarina sp. 2201CG14-23]